MNLKLLTAGATACVATVSLLALGAPRVLGASGQVAQQPARCTPPPATPSSAPPPVTAATITTITEAYYCILDHYYDGPDLDDRTMLVGAFAAFTQELQRRGIDQANATLPALTGQRDADIAAFAAVYEHVTASLPGGAAVREAVAAATIRGMIASLQTNHVEWGPLGFFALPSLGMTISDGNGPGAIDPAAVAPLFVKTVSADSPAARAGVKPGDVITSVNGVPPFAGGTAVKAVSDWITNPSIGVPVRIRLRRPSTGSTFSVTLTPSTTNAGPPPNNDRLLRGDIAYVQVPGFFPGATKQVLAAISDMRARARLRGLILDLRGNGGGDPAERAALLGMLAHGKITSYECDAHANCAPNYTDDSVPLVHLPVIVLTDRDCASACDSFATGVKDLHLGVIVGTRTAGIAAGVQVGYELDNGTGIQMPDKYEVGANHEMVNGIGVAPDYYAPLTAAALSGGGDPGLDKALAILSMP